MAASIHAGDVLAGRYRMVDLLVEADGSWIWNAHDRLLHRPVAIHLIEVGDPRADVLMETAREVSALTDRRALRVLDCNRTETFCYVVNEWSQGTSLDVALDANGPMPPVRAAWLVHEVADIVATLHAAGVAHGHVAPESVMIDENAEIRVIGTGVEAALMRLPTTDRDVDVHGLVALLYATLTGRWPGPRPVSLPTAPRSGGRFLRPRQVRPGIPRALDLICDEVLNGIEHHGVPGIGGALGATLSSGLGSVFSQREPHHLSTAAGVRDALEQFLDEHDPELSMAVHTAPVSPDALAPVHRAWQPPEEAPVASASPAAASIPRPADVAGTSDVSDSELTMAGNMTDPGIPVFDDSGDVDWLPTGGSGRPLFASDEATKARQHRLDQMRSESPAPENPEASGGKHRSSGRPDNSLAANPQHRVPDEYWAWDTTNGSTGSGLIPVVPGGPVPGRNWLRLAWVVGVAALVLLVGAGFLHSRTAERSEQPDARPPSSVPTPSVTAQPLTDLVATDFDPRDGSGEEYPEDAPKAVDGDLNTFWGTSTYRQQLGPGGIKDGVGLVVDLGQPEVIREVRVTVIGGETGVQAFATDEAPTTIDDLAPVATGIATDELVLTLDEAITTQFVTVWLTALPEQDGGFRGKVAEISVLG